MKKIYKALPAILFCGFLLTMFVLFIALPKKEYSASEKRNLKQAPAFSWDAFIDGAFGRDFKEFLEDQTPGRNLWVGVGAYFNLFTGNNGDGGIYCGSDGYLINDPQEMTCFENNISYVDECAEHLEVPAAVLIAPSTGYICEDKLPAVHLSYHDDEYFTALADGLSHADFVDIRDDFKREYAAGNQLYYKTDHHWTSYGAYVAYRALADTLGYQPNGRDAYTVTAVDGFYGTTYSGSGFWMNGADTLEIWDNRANNGKLHVAITDNGVTTEHDGLFFDSHLDEDDKYPVFLDGNHPYTVITNANASSSEKLLVVKDSFAHSLVPFLADHYAEIVMVDMRYYRDRTTPELVGEMGADRVLFVYSVDNFGTEDSIAEIE